MMDCQVLSGKEGMAAQTLQLEPTLLLKLELADPYVKVVVAQTAGAEVAVDL